LSIAELVIFATLGGLTVLLVGMKKGIEPVAAPFLNVNYSGKFKTEG
jgi:hypothetical protein